MKNPEKLIAAKILFAEEGRFLTGRTALPEDSRVPPGQGLVKGLPILDLGVQPEIALDAWTLKMEGCVKNPLTLDNLDIRALPQTLIKADIHCVTSWTRLDSHWEGVLLSDLLKSVHVSERALYVLLHCEDGYTVNLLLSDLCAEQSMLAHTFDGEPISTEHGGPYRLVIPSLYFWKSPKWVRRIEFLEDKIPGYWEQRGYHDRGDPWKEQRYGPKQSLPRPPEAAIAAPVFVTKKNVWAKFVTWWTPTFESQNVMKTNYQRRFKDDKDPRVVFSRYYVGGNVRRLELSDREVWACATSTSHTNGKRGIARDKRGAKKFVASRARFHESRALARLVRQGDILEQDGVLTTPENLE